MSKITQHQRAYGQFFTPQAVVAACYGLLAGALDRPAIVDPACGDGAFLRYALEHAIAAREQISGCDLDASLVEALAKGGLLGVRAADGLDSQQLAAGAFDLVIGNPPFGVTTSSHGREALASEARFLLRALDLARPGGYVALVLPSGVLANERLRALRADLLARSSVLAVIALPRNTFRHTGTTAACSILLLRNAPAQPSDLVFFALPSQLGDLPAVVAAYHASARPSEREICGSGGQAIDSKLAILHADAPAQASFWLAHSPQLARRMDAHFWRPEHRALLGRMAARFPLRPLGDQLDRQRELIAGDHVRPARGERKGPGLTYEYYQTREFMAAGYNYADLERCDDLAYRRLGHTAVQRNDILISCAGVGGAGRGRVCLITHEPGASCTGDVIIVRARQLDPLFLFLFLACQAGRQQLLRLQNGVGTANLSAAELLQVEVPLLSPAAQFELAASYAPVAAAHHAAMAALLRADQAGFRQARARSEALLAELLARLEALLLGRNDQPEHILIRSPQAGLPARQAG